MKVAIVTGADERYARLLQETLSSIGATAPQPAGFDLFVLDGGLSQRSRAWVEGFGARIVPAEWRLPEALFDKPFYRVLVSKPFLPEIVPGYDLYVWIDADAWVQDWEAVRMLLAAASEHGLAAVPEADRAYMEGHGALPTKLVRSSLQTRITWLRAGFGEEIMRELAYYPTINVGVFAARADSPMWRLWAERYLEGMSHNRDLSEGYRFMMEQTAFNVAALKHVREFARLPAWCNWTCLQALPIVVGGDMLLEAGYPHRPLGIVHPVGKTKFLKIQFRAKDGTPRERTLRYPGPIARVPRPPA